MAEVAGLMGLQTPSVMAVSGATLEEDLDDSETGVNVSDGTLFNIGQTIKIDDEEMNITGISTNTLTVVRGFNGTTAAAHTDTDQDISENRDGFMVMAHTATGGRMRLNDNDAATARMSVRVSSTSGLMIGNINT